MPKGHAVVDGSNIATEGRAEPSLAQLREAVAEFEAENDFRYVTVIVDASFEHRVPSREKKAARAAIDDGEIITPPAGVVGRGDTFILEVADRAGAVVLSNDSFQEFHGKYPWLFDDGRLIGGKPVPGVGWIYVPRTPVRGPVSRRATKSVAPAKKAAKATKIAKKAPARAKRTAAASKTPTSKTPTSKTAAASKTPTSKTRTSRGRPAIGATKKTRAQRESDGPTGSNTLKRWRAFRHDYPVGSTVAVTIEQFSSHGAYGSADNAVVYVPNRLLGDPPPNRARDALRIGDTRDFIVHRFDDERRGIDLGLVPVGGGAPAKKPAAKKSGAPRRAASEKAAKKKSTGAKRTPATTSSATKTAKKATRGAAKKKSTGAPKTAAEKTATRRARKRR